MIIKIGQLQAVINSGGNNPSIRLGVENAKNKYAPLLDEPLDFCNIRKIAEEEWFETLEFLNLTNLFYNEQYGLFKKDGDITPISQKHVSIINDAYSQFFNSYPYCKAVKYAMVGIDGRLKKAILTKEDTMACHIKWLHFWINYAINFCSQPVITNLEFLEIEKTGCLQ